MPVSSVEFGGFWTDQWVRVDDRRYAIGDRVEGRYGFELDTKLSIRLFDILLALAIARLSDPDPDGGWVSADELAAIIDNQLRPHASGTHQELERRTSAHPARRRKTRSPAPSANATGHFLSRILRGYCRTLGDEVALTRNPDTYLIQYERVRAMGKVLAYGRMRGPYRLNVPRDRVEMDRGALVFQLPPEPIDLESALQRAEELVPANDYVTARGLLLSGLFGPCREPGRDDVALIAAAHHLLSHYAIQLGISKDAIQSARRARRLFDTLGDPVAVTSTFVTESLAESQLNHPFAALGIVRQAAAQRENAAPAGRKRLRYSLLIAFGQRYIDLGRFSQADRHLLAALRIAEASGDAVKICRALIRRAESFIGRQNLSAAEQVLGEAHAVHGRYIVGRPETPVLWRITAGFMASAGRWSEAREWAGRATDYADQHRLSNELRRLRRIIPAIEQFGSTTA